MWRDQAAADRVPVTTHYEPRKFRNGRDSSGDFCHGKGGPGVAAATRQNGASPGIP